MQIELVAVKTAKFSILSNISLTLSKFIIGIIIGSISIISEAIHSFVDLLAALMAYYAVKKASMPPDKAHPYGYGKFENISGIIEALLIFIAAIYIVYESIKKLLYPSSINMPVVGILVMLFSVLVNFFVSRKLFYVAKEMDSVALEANAWHLRADVYTSIGIMFVLSIITFIDIFKFHANIFYWLDSIAAFVVAFMITKTAWKLISKSAKDLFDASLPNKEISIIENVICQNDDIVGYHALKTRKSGNKRFVEFHILVNPKMTVYRSHEITREINFEVSGRLENSIVTIHVEPCDNTCTLKCLEGCLIKACKSVNIRK
ncbi:MAG: cation diffusion facilitator family transporter [Endomicrobium sp.]|nr:cation diffusion facilitator family transporter [Endomicrobium sp.]